MNDENEPDWWSHGGDDVPREELDLHPWLLSSTDLLVAWAPEEAWLGAAPERGRAAWDRYFEPRSPRSVPDAGPEPSDSEFWDAESAELVVDCLYRFLHAIERCDIVEVMQCVASDYQAFENDLEINREGLRLRLEASLEAWRGERFRVALTEIPDPLFHPSGVLIRVTLQVDFWSKPHGRSLTELLGRILWFRAQPDGSWLLAGMAATN